MNFFSKADQIPSFVRSILRHTPIIAMLTVIALLMVGIIANGSNRAIVGMILFGVVTVASYMVLMQFGMYYRRLLDSAADIFVLNSTSGATCAWLIGLFAIAVTIIHFAFFNGLTIGPALLAKTNIEVALIRMDLTEGLPVWMQYLKSFAINVFFPIGLLIAVIKRMTGLATTIAVAGIFYGMCMMQKSGPLLLVSPIVAYFICTQKWFRAAGGLLLLGATIYLMGMIANPTVQPAAVKSALQSAGAALPYTAAQDLAQRAERVEAPAPPLTTAKVAPVSLSYGLFERLAFVPGEVAAAWFNAVPAEVPYALGCGYRFLTTILGCEFQNYSLILYSKFNPEYANSGLRGSSNAASMMTAYANFGMIGITLSGVIHGTLAWILYVLFYRSPELCPAFNLPYLLLLSSGDLFTMLLSGGWALSIIVYAMLCRPLGRTSR